MMTFVCYERCGTCKKAEKWLKEQGLDFAKRPIKEENPSAEELRDWQKKSGLPLKKFFNTSGKLYKEGNYKERIPAMSEEEIFADLARDGMLVKRPILVNGDTVLVGFKEEEWKKALLPDEQA